MSDKLIYIEWWDHCSAGSSSWRDKSEVENMEPQLVKSIGWVVKETDKHLILVSTTVNEQMSGDFCIIKSCIKKRKNVKI